MNRIKLILACFVAVCLLACILNAYVSVSIVSIAFMLSLAAYGRVLKSPKSGERETIRNLTNLI